jgi:hypothetical protein
MALIYLDELNQLYAVAELVAKFRDDLEFKDSPLSTQTDSRE